MTTEFRTDPLALAELVGGTWDPLPSDGWRLDVAAPLSEISRRTLQRRRSGLLYAMRPDSDKAQVEMAAQHPEKWALITTDSATVPKAPGMGVLRVADLGAARNAMSAASRAQYCGKIIAITGSVGKTTVRRMLDTTLKSHHSLHTSRRIDNGFRVLRDQLLSLKDEEYATFEIARIALPGGEDLARPDVAVISALAEAHMEDLGSLKDIARLKAQLLKGVPKSGTGVINIDSPHVDEVLQIAEEQGIRAITYGKHPQADIRLMDFNPKNSLCHVMAFGQEYSYRIATSGQHNAVNTLAVLGVLTALDLPIPRYLGALSTFTPVRGRGKTHEVTMGESTVTVIDESYNANPTSMRAALQGFGEAHSDRRKLLVLGDMLELGPTSPELHAGLAADVLTLEPDVVVLVGSQIRALYQALPDAQAAVHMEDVEQLGTTLVNQLRDGDAVFVKGSNGLKLRGVVEDLIGLGDQGQGPATTNS